MKFEESIIIDHPVGKVFKYVSNYRSHKKFTRTLKDSKQLTKGAVRVGTELYAKVVFLGRSLETNSEVVAYEPNRQFAFKSKNGPIPTAFDYHFEEMGEDRTEVKLVHNIEPGSFYRLGETFLRPRIGEELAVSMKQLKKVLEAKSA